MLTVSEEWMLAPAGLGGVTTSFPKLESEAEDKASELAHAAKAVLNTLYPRWQIDAQAARVHPASH